MVSNCVTIFQHIVLDVALPTVDTYGDINFAISAFSTNNVGIGVLMITPVVINWLFTLCKWKMTSFDGKKEKWFSWVFVFLNIWPQYQVLKVIFAIVTKKPENDWKKSQDKIKKELSYMEPFIEGIPQMFISIGIFAMLAVRSAKNDGKYITALGYNGTNVFGDDGLKKIKTVFGETTLGISNNIMFPLSICISFLGSVKSTVDYLHNSPMKISSRNSCLKVVIFTSTLIYVTSSFLKKTIFHLGFSILVPFYSDAEFHGGWTALCSFTVLVLVPGLFTVAPLVRYLGVWKFAKLYLIHPPLLTLPFITDYIFGPLDGYGCCRCCCWCCKCVRFNEGSVIRILKGMSWAKYSSFILYDILVSFVFQGYFFSDGYSDVIFITFLNLLPAVAFAITLHVGKINGVLDLENHDRNLSIIGKKAVENVAVEMDSCALNETK